MLIRFAGDGVTLTADAEGAWSGPAVLLLHGGGQTRQSWGGTSQVLADAGFLALTVDQRGHGESDWAADGNYGISAYARDVRAVASQLGRPVALVGASPPCSPSPSRRASTRPRSCSWTSRRGCARTAGTGSGTSCGASRRASP